MQEKRVDGNDVEDRDGGEVRRDDQPRGGASGAGRGVGRRAVLGAAASAGTAAVAGCLSGGDSGDDAGAFQQWLGGLSEYDGVVDETGSDRVTVTVGAGDDGLAFDPVAVAVDAGTTVVWEWTGKGGRHNVVDRDGAFQSDYYDQEGATFEYTFEEAGTFEYYCEPHRGLGMRGGVEVR